MKFYKENTAYAEPLAKAEADVALIQEESYTFYQDKNRGPAAQAAGLCTIRK